MPPPKMERQTPAYLVRVRPGLGSGSGLGLGLGVGLETPAYCGCMVKTLKGKPVHHGTW